MWNVMTVGSEGSPGDGWYYPTIEEESLQVVFDQTDGSDRAAVKASALDLHFIDDGKLDPLMELRKVAVTMTVTDSRVAFTCPDWDKGGGWVGTGVVLVAAANVASRARAARRRQGKVLVGHIRHDWLRSVGHQPRSGWNSPAGIRFIVADATSHPERQMVLTVQLPKGIDPGPIADEVARRAAQHRLEHAHGLDEEALDALRAMGSGGSVADRKGKFSFRRVPGAVAVSAPDDLG